MDLVRTMVPLAIVITLSPLPIIPVLLVLMSANGRAKGIAFLAAFVTCLAALTAVATLLGSRWQAGEPDEAGVGWIQVGTGVLLLAFGIVKWLRRPAADQPKEPPAWMAAIDSYTPRQAARLGGTLGALNPKNAVMALAAGAEIALFTDTPGQAVLGLATFVVVGSLGVLAPVLAVAILGDRAEPGLARAKAWLDRNNTALSVVVLAILGILLILGGIPSVA